MTLFTNTKVQRLFPFLIQKMFIFTLKPDEATPILRDQAYKNQTVLTVALQKLLSIVLCISEPCS